MIVVADASVLVAELVRRRGRALLSRADLRVVVAEEQWDETEHELTRRLAIIVDQGRLTTDRARQLHQAVQALIDDRGNRGDAANRLRRARSNRSAARST